MGVRPPPGVTDSEQTAKAAVLFVFNDKLPVLPQRCSDKLPKRCCRRAGPRFVAQRTSELQGNRSITRYVGRTTLRHIDMKNRGLQTRVEKGRVE